MQFYSTLFVLIVEYIGLNQDFPLKNNNEFDPEIVKESYKYIDLDKLDYSSNSKNCRTFIVYDTSKGDIIVYLPHIPVIMSKDYKVE